MTIKKQKIIKYIPIAQVITLFCWIGYYSKNNIKQSDFIKTMMKMFAFVLALTIPRIALNYIFNNDLLNNILFYVSIYPYFWGLATIAVADQEKHEKALASEKTDNPK